MGVPSSSWVTCGPGERLNVVPDGLIHIISASSELVIPLPILLAVDTAAAHSDLLEFLLPQ